jgi:hypothetical protein
VQGFTNLFGSLIGVRRGGFENVTADVTYITSFRQLRLTDQLPGHFELLPGVNITNDPALKQRLLTPDYGRAAGVIELAHLQQANNVVFGELRESDMLGASAEPFLLAILIWIEGLFDNAWLLKDHAMRCEAAHLAHRTSAGTYWTSNFLSYSTDVRRRNSGGNRRDVQRRFTRLGRD